MAIDRRKAVQEHPTLGHLDETGGKLLFPEAGDQKADRLVSPEHSRGYVPRTCMDDRRPAATKVVSVD